MKSITILLLAFLLLPAVHAFSIEDYQSNVFVNTDGSISVYEKMTFNLDQQFNEGFRSIRKEDFKYLSDISLNSVIVNGAPAPHSTAMNGDQAEIIWKKTYLGSNVVELNYTISDRVQLYNDFAKLCFEHYGANWQVAGKKFSARTTLPESNRGKTIHFEVYSGKDGSAYVDDLSIVIEMDNVPSGNYVGGCYLFDRSSVSTTNTVDAQAYAILKNEREIYGSKTVLEAEKPNLECCCFPVLLISLIGAVSLFLKEKQRPKLPETILPPGKEEPVVVSSLVRNKYETKELVAATIVDLINRGIIDIVELEKKDAPKGAEIKRERTILFLKTRPSDLKDYENTVLDFIFCEGKEVDLDAKMKEYDKIKSKEEAKELAIYKAVKKLNDDFPEQVKNAIKDDEIRKLGKSSSTASIAGVAVLAFFGIMILFGIGGVSFDLGWYALHGEWIALAFIIISGLVSFALLAYIVFTFAKPGIPKKVENKELYAKWDAFYRGLKSSRISEHPPGSAVIWGDILKYATALGQAKKVKSHLSELDSAIVSKIEKMDDVALASMTYYGSALAIRNLGVYGNRQGVSNSGSHGGFSSASSGGWSSGGGGGFSGGSSGGGGFR